MSLLVNFICHILLYAFHLFIVDQTKSKVEVMNELVAADSSKFDFTTRKSYDKHGTRYYETVVDINGLCTLHGKHSSKRESKPEALKVAYARFFSWTNLIKQFQERK